MVLLVILLLFNGASFSQSDTSEVQEPLYTAAQIDSIYPTIRSYFFEGNHVKIIEEVPLLLENARLLEEKEIETKFRNILGNTFIQLDDYDRANDLFTEALIRAQQEEDATAIASAYISLGNTYISKDPDKSITYFEEALDYTGAVENSDTMDFIIHNNLAELHIGVLNPKKAQYHLDKALYYLSQSGLSDRSNEYRAVLNHIQGAIYLEQKEYSKAIAATLKSLEVDQGEVDQTYILNNYKNLMSAYEQTEQYEKLNEVRKRYDPLLDKRYEEDKIREQQIARSKFDVEGYKKELRASQLETEISQQKASKNKLLFNFAAILVSIMLAIVAGLLIARYRRNELLTDLKRKNRQYLEAKEKSEKLAQSNTRFLSTISHELRTPLYGIIGLSSVLLKDDKPANRQEIVESLKFSADYLLALVNDVLHINKFDSQEGKILKQDLFSVEKLMYSIVQSFEFINKKNNNTVHVSIAPGVPKIAVGDKTKISQVLMNLLSNASKFTEDGSINLTITGVPLDSNRFEASFSIRDTGPGIPIQEQSRIFEEFTQIKKEQDQGGTGLGLPIVNKILKIMGSKLNFTSVPGEGTTFSFDMVLISGSQEDLELTKDAPRIEHLKGKKVLIVDDNKINQLVTQKVLEQNGIAQDIASNGFEAIEKVKEEVYDAILMDINMPVMDGLEASREIRKINPTIPIIALTATNYEKLEGKTLNNDINDIIVKPYNTEILLKVLLKHTV